MKITRTVTMASALLFAAGCAQEQQTMRLYETGTPSDSYSGQTEYPAQNNISTPASGYYPSYPGNAGTPQRSDKQSDNTILARVRETLRQDPEIALVLPNIQISANNGAIILSGSVPSDEQKRQIVSRVQNVTGVATVNNQLNVIAGLNELNNSDGSPLKPTSNGGSERLYKDAASGTDTSTNSVLNPTSRDHGPGQLYRESIPAQSGSTVNPLTPTSSENGSTQIYKNFPGEKLPGQNTNTNHLQPVP